MEKSDDGWFYVETSVSKSGFVHLQAKACDANKQIIDGIATYNGGAGADIENILCATKEPCNYNEFWDKLKTEVEATTPDVLLCDKKPDENYPDFEMYDMRIKAPGSDYVSVSVAYPKGAAENSLKFAMLFQGYGVTPATPYPLDGYFTVHVNAHCNPNYETDEFYAEVRDNKLKGYGYDADENKNPETTYWAKMFLRDLQALRFFENHKLINKKDYYFVGSSQGGMQACHLAAHCGYDCTCLLFIPWCCDLWATEKEKRMRGWRPDTSVAMNYFDTALAASKLKCPVYIEAGLGDYVCPPSGQIAMYNAITSPKMLRFVQNQTHPYRPPVKRYYTLDGGFEDKNFKF